MIDHGGCVTGRPRDMAEPRATTAAKPSATDKPNTRIGPALASTELPDRLCALPMTARRPGMTGNVHGDSTTNAPDTKATAASLITAKP